MGSRDGGRGGRSQCQSGPENWTAGNLHINSEEPRFDLTREKVVASTQMKNLTQKYGTKGKSPKYIFLQAFREGQRADAKGLFAKIPPPRPLSCEAEDSTTHGFLDSFDIEQENVFSQPEPIGHSALAQTLTRPAAMVTQSNFVKRLEEQVKLEVYRAGCQAPRFDMDWIHEEIRGPKPGPNGAEGEYETYGIPDSVSDEPEERMVARLKIYRRAFSALILHFEALRPILKDIKRNYDGMLTFREKQVAETTKVKQNIHHLELSLDERMASVRFEGFKQLAELERQCFLLLRHVDKQDLAMRTMTDILNKLETSLSEEHDSRRDSEDQRKLLIVEVNELRRKLGMTPRSLENTATIQIDEGEEEQQEIDIITTEDPILLRRALEITRANLSEAHHRLTILEADYADVIPRHEFEELKVVMSSLEAEHAEMISTYEAVNSKTDGLRETIEKLTGERNTLSELVGDLRKRATPRPSWEKFGEHIDGGIPKWKSLIEGRSTAEIVPALIQELTGKRLLGPPEFIKPLGSGPDVPPLLRHDAQIRRRDFSRRDVLIVLQDIWQARAEKLDLLRRYNEARDEEANGGYGSSPIGDVPDEKPLIGSFMDFVSEYFETRFPLPNMRAEWIYNILETCRKLGRIEPKLTQFLDIFEGRRDEGVYHLFRAQVGKLRNAVIAKSEETGQSAGSIQFGDFGKVLRENFVEKTDEGIKRLLAAASSQTGIHAEFSYIKYIAFFAMTDEGLVGTFVEEFAKEFEEDRLKYVYEVLSELLGDLGVSLSSGERENDPAGETDVTLLQVFSAFLAADPTLSDDKLGSALTWIFFGISTLPGASPRGTRLVDYLRTTIRLLEFRGGEDQDEESDDFERAINDVLTEKELEELSEMGEKQKKRWVQKKKVTNLGMVVRRLKGGPFLRHGQRFPSSPSPGNEGTPKEEAQRDSSKGEQEGEQQKVVKKMGAPAPPEEVTTSAAAPPTGGTPAKKDKKKQKKGK